MDRERLARVIENAAMVWERTPMNAETRTHSEALADAVLEALALELAVVETQLAMAEARSKQIECRCVWEDNFCKQCFDVMGLIYDAEKAATNAVDALIAARKAGGT